MSQALTAHHAAARKIVLSVDQLLESLETGRDTSVTLQSEISQHLNALAREVQALEAELALVGPSERSLWRKRITQLQEQSKSQVRRLLFFISLSFFSFFLQTVCRNQCSPSMFVCSCFVFSQRAALSKYAGRAAAQRRELEDREALLQRRNGAAEHTININDAYANESKNLAQSDAQLDALQEHATASLSALMSQRASLKGVQRKVRDMAATLGLSNSVLKAIERRQFWDKLILFGGMILTLALVWFVFHYLRLPPAEEAMAAAASSPGAAEAATAAAGGAAPS